MSNWGGMYRSGPDVFPVSSWLCLWLAAQALVPSVPLVLIAPLDLIRARIVPWGRAAALLEAAVVLNVLLAIMQVRLEVLHVQFVLLTNSQLVLAIVYVHLVLLDRMPLQTGAASCASCPAQS